MREYDNLFGAPSQSGRDPEHEQLFRKYSDMNFEEMGDASAILPESDLMKMFQFMTLNNPKGREKEFIAYLNKVDRHGYALVHYLCYLRKGSTNYLFSDNMNRV